MTNVDDRMHISIVVPRDCQVRAQPALNAAMAMNWLEPAGSDPMGALVYHVTRAGERMARRTELNDDDIRQLYGITDTDVQTSLGDTE